MARTGDIVRFVIETPDGAIPGATTEWVKRSCFDAIGVLLAGSTQPVGEAIQRYVRARGGNPEATVIGPGFKTSVTEAALANGTMAHALDYDDMGAYGHPTVPLLPALLAIGEWCGSSGRQVLACYCIGFEVGTALYQVGGYNQYERGFHSTPVFGTIAAAAASARLLGLDVERTAMALGIAASEASGVGRNNGTMTKPLHAGLAARNGVTAALLAKEGVTAAPDIFEAKQGFCETFLGDNRYDLDRIVASLGNPFKAQDALIIKKYPCCGGNHSALDAVLGLMREHDLTYDQIELVEVQAMPYTSPVLRYPEPRTGLNGKFSIQHAVGAAIRDGRVAIEHFTDEAVRDPGLQAAARKVRAEVMARWDPRFMYGQMDANPVVIHLKDGRILSKAVGKHELKGSPKDPLSTDELVAKFRSNAGLVLKNQTALDRAVDTWLALDEVSEIGAAIQMVCA
jgi:2-methylcitrate dehydratase PrpD